MDNPIHCPVCAKAGIADYRATEVTCPQCNSDLRPYFLLHRLRDGSGRATVKRQGFSPVLTGIAGLAVGALLLGFIMKGRTSPEPVAKAGNPAPAADSSAFYRLRIAELEGRLRHVPASAKAASWRYTVKAGDNLWDIATRYYGDGREHTRISTDNRLPGNAVLLPGQVLDIHPL